jgi:DNA gyrase subunit A
VGVNLATPFDESKLKIIDVEINSEMKKSYIDYAMSVIIGRALPDVRDGLKPVHKRILYAMYEDGIYSNKAYKKAATTVGNVLGRYHPHGDAAVYDTMVRMAQDFSLRYPLIDGHGNFGSIDGDAPAAYRYTEARMSKISMEMLTDIEKNTVDFVPNFDETRKEPLVLPSRFPNLLANGSNGIAVGMATNIPPHNISELVDGIVALMDNPELSIDEIMRYIKGPDFPTGAVIMGQSGIRSAYHTGRGKLHVRARGGIEPWKPGRDRIVFTEIPYMLSKARILERISEMVHEHKLEGISDIRDESDRDGLRIVVELKHGTNSNVVLNQLYKYSQLEDTFNIIMLAIVDGEPKILNLKQMLEHYINFQKEIIIRRTKFDKNKAEERKHILEGLRIALASIDEVIDLIRKSRAVDDAKNALKSRFGLSDTQVNAIVEMRLGKLASLEVEKINNEFDELVRLILSLDEILASDQKVIDVIKTDLLKIKEKFGDERRTSIEAAENDIDIEDLIEETDCVFTLTNLGYVKRINADTYKNQGRGGRGIIGLKAQEEDFVSSMFVASSHADILFFTDKGRVYRIKAYQIPESGRQAKGLPIVNLIDLASDETVKATIPILECDDTKFLMFATKDGIIKKTAAREYKNINKNGKIAITLHDGDELIKVKLTSENDEIIIGTHNGMIIRFNEGNVRETGRSSAGVRGVRFREGDYAISMNTVADGAELLIVTEKGYGKKTVLSEYRKQSRGGLGLNSYKISEKTGKIAAFEVVTDDDDLMLMTLDGTIIRVWTKDIRSIGRNTSGVHIMRLPESGKIVAISKIDHSEDEITEGIDDEAAAEDSPSRTLDETEENEINVAETDMDE